MKSLPDCRLYCFVDTAFLRGRNPAEIAAKLCEGGADIIQLRAKDQSAEEIARMAAAIRPVLQSHGVPLVVNDHPRVAAEMGAEFCHLGQEDFFDAGHTRVSSLFSAGGKRPKVGLSTHAPNQALRAISAGADYIAVGPVFATGTKPTAAPVTLDYVRWAAASVEVPWFAIGGIHLGNLPDVLAAGATRVCVVSAILNAADIAGACRAFKRQLTGGR